MNTHNTSSPRYQFFASETLASFVVFLVALPLCMGIAIASGLTPAQGIITGIIGGIIVGALAGSPLQVSGPAAGLTVIVWEIVQRHGVAALAIIVALAGMVQILAGILRLGQWFRAVSPAVIHGMLAGIGLLIFFSQFHVMLDGSPLGSGIQNILGVPSAIFNAITASPQQGQAGMIGLITIASILLWNRFKPQKLKLIPAPLVGVALGTLATHILGFHIKFVPMPDQLFGDISLLTPTTLLSQWDWAYLIPISGVALVASAETLLCASAVDQMHSGPRTQYNKELIAQGIGNFLCGILHCLPMTGVIVRSSANIEAGGKTRASAILHGVWLLGFAVLIPFTLKLIPTAALAAILVFTGYKLINIAVIQELRTHGRAEVLIYFSTLGMIIFTDLLVGVLVGIGLSFVNVLFRLSHLKIALNTNPETGRKVLLMEGSAVFFHIPKIAAILDSLPKNTDLEIDIDQLSIMDHACLTLLSTWQKTHGKLIFTEHEAHPIKALLEKGNFSGH